MSAPSTFEQCFGEPVRRASQGGYFLSDRIVERSIALGIEVDVTVEPGLAAKIGDPSFGNHATAASPSFVGFPRHPYYPSRAALVMPARSADDARRILIVPLTSYDYKTALLPWRQRIRRDCAGSRLRLFRSTPGRRGLIRIPTGISSLERPTKARPVTSRLRFAPMDRTPRVHRRVRSLARIPSEAPHLEEAVLSSIRWRLRFARWRMKR